jgi:hypothetical protein
MPCVSKPNLGVKRRRLGVDVLVENHGHDRADGSLWIGFGRPLAQDRAWRSAHLRKRQTVTQM